MLFQCIDVQNITVYNCSENNTAGVICGMPSPNVTILMSVTSVRFVYTCIKYEPNNYLPLVPIHFVLLEDKGGHK